MEYYILDQNLNIIDGVDLYSSMIWNDSYYDTGDFELYIPYNKERATFYEEALDKRYIIVPSTDDPKAMRGMIITKIQDDLPYGKAKHLIISGVGVKSLLNQRIVWGKKDIGGEIESELRDLINENCISTENPDRQIPKLVLGRMTCVSDPNNPTIVNASLTGNFLGTVLTTICKAYKIGWDVKVNFTDKLLEFIIYKGVDRSYSQEGPVESRNPYVVFSSNFDNLSGIKYAKDITNYKNIILVGASYREQDEKTGEYKEVNLSEAVKSEKLDKRPIGLERFELYTDNSNVSDDYLSNLNAYQYLLKTKGKTELDKYSSKTEVSGEVVPNYSFKLNVDYFLGDLVSIVGDNDKRYDARVTSIKRTRNTSKDNSIPSFTIENWTGKEEEKDKSTKDEDVRVTDDGSVRLTENGLIRVRAKGYEYQDRISIVGFDSNGNEIADTRSTYGGDTRISTYEDRS